MSDQDYLYGLNDGRASVEGLFEALELIETLGHGDGHGRGYTCATIAADALAKYRENQ